MTAFAGSKYDMFPMAVGNAPEVVLCAPGEDGALPTAVSVPRFFPDGEGLLGVVYDTPEQLEAWIELGWLGGGGVVVIADEGTGELLRFDVSDDVVADARRHVAGAAGRVVLTISSGEERPIPPEAIAELQATLEEDPSMSSLPAEGTVRSFVHRITTIARALLLARSYTIKLVNLNSDDGEALLFSPRADQPLRASTFRSDPALTAVLLENDAQSSYCTDLAGPGLAVNIDLTTGAVSSWTFVDDVSAFRPSGGSHNVVIGSVEDPLSPNAGAALFVPEDVSDMRAAAAFVIRVLYAGYQQHATPAGPRAAAAGRNDPCPCGSGQKYKRCHGA